MRRGCVPLYLALLTIIVLLFLSPTIAWCPWPHNKTKVQLDSIFGDSKKFESSSKFVHLKYHIGPVLTANITVHAIWYGAWQHNQKKIIREFINSIAVPDYIPGLKPLKSTNGDIGVDGMVSVIGHGIRWRFLVQWVWNRVVNYCSGPNGLDQNSNTITVGPSPHSLLFFVYLGLFLFFFFFGVFIKWEFGFW